MYKGYQSSFNIEKYFIFLKTTHISQGIELLKIIFSCDWEFFSTNWEKVLLNLIGNGALFRPLRHPKKIPGRSLNIIVIYMYIARGEGRPAPVVHFFYQTPAPRL